MRIGELGERAGVDTETIRYYEKVGILPKPVRTEGNYRHYGEPQVDRLRFVRHCRALDMTLDEVRALLTFRDAPESSCGEVNALLDEHISHVTLRIAALSELEAALKKLRRQCRTAQKSKDCGILAGIGRETVGNDNQRKARHITGAH